MKPATLTLIAALILTACASRGPESQWTSREGAQPFQTARSACEQISYGIETNFITCMAGRGWVRQKR